MTFTLQQLSEITESKLIGDPETIISGVAILESATKDDASFLSNQGYRSLLLKTKAGVVCIDSYFQRVEGLNYLISDDPSRTFQKIAEALLGKQTPTGFSGIHPTAIIHEKAQLAENVSVGPYAVIDQNAVIGSGSFIGPFTYVGGNVQIGENCHLYAHSTIRENCSLGNRVILQPGAVIGSCGFGYIPNEKGKHIKLEQIGNVIVEDDVEIGANTTIDRARFKTTRIRKGTKIDNLVQIAHNVEIGENNILCAQTGIAGSSKTGRNVMMGGQVGILGHVEITDFVMIATRGGVGKSIKEKGKYGGSPFMPLAEYNRTQVKIRKIDQFTKKIEALEKRISELESELTTERSP